jgi:ABC-2 type transport system permease protein
VNPAASLRSVVAVYGKELRSYFASPLGVVFIVFYVLVSNGFFFFVADFFRSGQATMRGYFEVLPWIFLFFVPAVAMRLWAEERKSGTLEVLLTLPLRDAEVVVGKFLAGLTFLALALACTLTVPLTAGVFGRPDWGVIAASYAGALLLGAAYLSIGLWASSLTESQVIAFITSVAVTFVLLAVGLAPMWAGSLGGFATACGYLSLLTHFQNILRGVLDTRDVVYYVSVVLLFLHLNAKNIESRKWK